MIYQNTNELLKYFKEIMKSKGIKIKDLAQKLNKTQAATSGLLNMKNISLDSLHEISNAINYDVEINFIEKSPDD